MIESVYPEIAKLRGALFGTTGKSRATVMVGAGLSRQAEPLSTTVNALPLWSDLARRIQHELGLKESSADPLALAQQFENRFGRVALDDLIIDAVPDDGHAPGEIHRQLLELPWTDVFTTNYDTLLERAAIGVFERRYETIYTPPDLSVRTAPRIVKLHGSLPSHRPFVITQGDYDKYPNTHAPFVNLVHQSVLENVFVLLGFSGDDPNFRAWTKWVEEQLGKHAPPIYLCGVLDLTPEARTKLQNKRVIPIDLGPLFPEPKYPQRDARRAQALVWFLQALAEAKPTRPIEWAPEEPAIAPRTDPPSPPVSQFTAFGEMSPGNDKSSNEKMLELSRTWGAQRREYPGWIVAPEDLRWRVWHRTYRWRHQLFAQSGNLPPADQLRIFRELIWRLDLCLVSVWTTEIDQIAALLERTNPFPGTLDLAAADSSITDLPAIAEDWIELAFAVVRVAREDLEDKKHALWLDRLEKLALTAPTLVSRLNAEKAYWHFAVLDLEKLEQHLETWRSVEHTPLGKGKLAALYGELSHFDRANELAGEALREVRNRLSATRKPLELLSLEAWLIILTEILAGSFRGRTAATRDRLAALAREHCDPEATREWFQSRLPSSEAPRKRKETESSGFDPGDRSRSIRHSGGGIEFEDLIPAFGALRVTELAPCILRTRHSSYLGYEAARAAVWLEGIAPFWTLEFIVRTSDKASIDAYMDRAAVARYKPERVDRLRQMLLRLARVAITRVPNNPRAAQDNSICEMGATALELLSRLAFRFTADQRLELVNLLTQYLAHDGAARSWVFDDEVSSLMSRIVFACSPTELPDVAMRLLELPVIGENKFGVRDYTQWPEPAWSLSQRSDWPADKPGVPENLVGRMARLLQEGGEEATRRALVRMQFLNDRGWLSPSQTAVFESALWSRIEPTHGLPRYLDATFPREWLDWPGAASHGVDHIVRTRLVRTMFPAVLLPDGKSMHANVLSGIRRRLINLRSLMSPLFRRAARLTVQADDAEAFVSGLEQWWPQHAPALVMVRDDSRWRFMIDSTDPQSLCNSLSAVLADGFLLVFRENRALVGRIGTLVAAIEKTGFDVSRAAVGMFGAGLWTSEQAAAHIEKKLFGDFAEELSSGGWMVLSWHRAHAIGILSTPPPARLSDLLAQRIALRAERGLEEACAWLATIVREFGISPSAREMVLRTLGTLIDVTDLERWEREFNAGMTTREEAHRLIELRANAARLAAAIAKSSPEPFPVLDRWQTIALADPLPEVQRGWREVE